MPVQHRLRFYSPSGAFITNLYAWKSIDCVLSEKGEGGITVALFPNFPDQLFLRDCRLEFERHVFTESFGEFFPTTPKLVGNTCWLLTGRERTVEANGTSTILLQFVHPNHILGRRVVAYDEDSTQAEKSDIASDVIYDVVNENFVAATDTTRNLSSDHFVLDPRPGPTFGATVDKSLSYRNVLASLQEIANSSAQQGAYIGFELYTPIVPGPFHFRIYSRVRGTNRGLTSGQPVILRGIYQSHNGYRSARVWEDWSSIVSFAYAGGSGKSDERVVSTASDSTLINQTPFGRVEFFRSVSTGGSAVASSEAQRVLREFRPRREFEASLGDQVRYRFGVDYDWGDIVGAQFIAPILTEGVVSSWVESQFDVRIDPVRITVSKIFDETGALVDIQEDVDLSLRSLSST